MQIQRAFKRNNAAVDVFSKLEKLGLLDQDDDHDDRRDIDTPATTSADEGDTTDAADTTAAVQDAAGPDGPKDGAADATAAAQDSASDGPDHDADDETVETPKHPRARRLLRRVLIVLAGVAFVAALGASGYLGWQLKQRDDTTAAGRAALAVARTYAVALTSVDSANIDQNFNQVLDGATGEFKDMYSQSAAQLRQILIDNKAVSKGTVVDAAIKSATKTKVDILLFVDQSITNAVVPGPRIDRNRVEITMELIDNHWLASKVDIK